MRPLLAFLILAAALVLLAAVAIGAMFSIGTGRPSWLLIGVFIADSIALVVVAAHMVLRQRGGGDR
jgi:hypothetical protein